MPVGFCAPGQGLVVPGVVAQAAVDSCQRSVPETLVLSVENRVKPR
jgi:hypothetical protein